MPNRSATTAKDCMKHLHGELRAALRIGERLPDRAPTLVTVRIQPLPASRIAGSTAWVSATAPR
jgi:hypothetical protein